MLLKKLIFSFFALLICYNLLFAGALLSRESLDHYNSGVSAQAAGNFAEAEAYYQKAILMESGNLTLLKYVFNNRGVIYCQQGDYKKAEATFREALRIDPNYTAARMNLGLVYDLSKTKDEAIKYWAEAFDLENLKPRKYTTEGEKRKEFW